MAALFVRSLSRCFNEECFLHYQGLFYPYRNQQMFLSTLYWRWVGEYAKFEEFGREVPERGRWSKLNVHHTTYAVCGQEHRHLNTLEVLGREQHNDYHAMNPYADHGAPPLLQRSSSPGSLPCSWRRNHPLQELPARWVFNEPDTAPEDKPSNDKIWLICDNCYEGATRNPTFEFLSPPSAPKIVCWEEGESDTFTDLDACEAWFFIHIIKRCEFERETGGFHLYDGLENMLKP